GEVVLARLGERHAGLGRAGERAVARLPEHVVEPVFGQALREVAGRGTATVRPGRADRPMHAPAVRQPIERAPALVSIDMTGGPNGRLSAFWHTVWNTVGTRSPLSRRSETTKGLQMQAFRDARGGIRTPD